MAQKAGPHVRTRSLRVPVLDRHLDLSSSSLLLATVLVIMAGRTLISYDDIVPSSISQASFPVVQTQSALPSDPQKPQSQQGKLNHAHFDHNSNGPPSKKRKRNNHNNNNRNSNEKFGQGHQNRNSVPRGRGRGNRSSPQQPRRVQNQTHTDSYGSAVQHWDDPGEAGASVHYEEATNGVHDEGEEGLTTVVLEDDGEEGWGDEDEYYDADMPVEAEEEEDEEESRELTHNEIWDDSALIDAWESAAAEYEVRAIVSFSCFASDGMSSRHFTAKKNLGKMNPSKSHPCAFHPHTLIYSQNLTLLSFCRRFRSRWYNVPPSSSKLKPSKKSAHGNEEVEDSKPLNFDSFVPQHDPSLVVAPELPTSQSQPDSSVAYTGAWASKDDSFKRALEATYWAGYWTAVYHVRASTSISSASFRPYFRHFFLILFFLFDQSYGKHEPHAQGVSEVDENEGEDDEEEEGEGEPEGDDGQDFMSTQR